MQKIYAETSSLKPSWLSRSISNSCPKPRHHLEISVMFSLTNEETRLYRSVDPLFCNYFFNKTIILF